MHRQNSVTVLDSPRRLTNTRPQGELRNPPGQDCMLTSVEQAILEMYAYRPNPQHRSVVTSVNCKAEIDPVYSQKVDSLPIAESRDPTLSCFIIS